MTILTIRTDKPEAEIGLYEGAQKLAYTSWLAHRELAESIHLKVKELLAGQQKDIKDIAGIIIFQGPGSFTGLRIGISVANALANSLKVPIVGTAGEHWLEQGTEKLEKSANDHLILPEYGAPPHTTKPRH